SGDLRSYHEHALEALRLAARTGDPVLEAVIAAGAQPSCWMGRVQEPGRVTEKASALGTQALSTGTGRFRITARLQPPSLGGRGGGGGEVVGGGWVGVRGEGASPAALASTRQSNPQFSSGRRSTTRCAHIAPGMRPEP